MSCDQLPLLRAAIVMLSINRGAAMKYGQIDHGRHAPVHEIDPLASAQAGEDRTYVRCRCGEETGDLLSHLDHARDALQVASPAWLPVGARLALLALAGLAVLTGMLLTAQGLGASGVQTALRAAAPTAFAVTMGLAHVLRRYFVPVRRAAARR